jgi:hypothetical protein
MDTQVALELATVEPEVSRAEARDGLRVLQTELALQKQHLRLLSEQSRFLIACDRVRFCRTQEAFPALLVSLEAQAKLRTAAFGTEPVIRTVDRWPQPEQKRGAALAAELHHLVTQIATLSAQNQRMIGNELHYCDFMLDLLVTAHRQCVIYAANGASAVNHGNLFINQVA